MNEIIVNGIFAIGGAVIGSVVSWALTTASANKGKLKVRIHNANYENDGGTCTIGFEVVVFNDKNEKSGINNCKVVADYDNGEITDFIALFKNDNDKDELKELSNVDTKTYTIAKYQKSGIECSGNTKYYLEYIINGKNKKKRLPIEFK